MSRLSAIARCVSFQISNLDQIFETREINPAKESFTDQCEIKNLSCLWNHNGYWILA